MDEMFSIIERTLLTKIKLQSKQFKMKQMKDKIDKLHEEYMGKNKKLFF